MKKTQTTLAAAAVVALLASGKAFAAPPYIEMYYINFPEENCLVRAEGSLTEAGFQLKKGTWQNFDRVAHKDDYKAVVSCVEDKKVVAVIVAGPVYKQTNEHALAIRENFKYWLDEKEENVGP